MTCQRCGGDFPGRKGRFCGTCLPVNPLEQRVKALEEVLGSLLAENAHNLVGGTAWAWKAIEHLGQTAHRSPKEGRGVET